MHEFSIVQNIVEIVLDTASRQNIQQINAVEVEVGQASGVVVEALEFAWEAAIDGTLLKDAVLRIRSLPLRVNCGNCRQPYQPENVFEACPVCGEIRPEIISGKELKVVAIETSI
jgi:hydrogenase nickel incorporation protein HypA/HybF